MIDINDPKYWEEILEKEWLWLLPWEDFETSSRTWSNAEKLCTFECHECINTFVWETKTRINLILCCKSHPETQEVSEEWFCPEVDPETWLCRIYDSDDYPAACKNYHCKTHWR